jgi:outer membrane lipopolysaccharide assembly protein LptE/RlpB
MRLTVLMEMRNSPATSLIVRKWLIFAAAPLLSAGCGFHINGTAVSVIPGHRFQ